MSKGSAMEAVWPGTSAVSFASDRETLSPMNSEPGNQWIAHIGIGEVHDLPAAPLTANVLPWN